MEETIKLLAKSASILPAREKGNCRIWFTWKDKPVFISAGTKRAKDAEKVKEARIREWWDKLPKESPGAPKAPQTLHPWKVEAARFLKLEHKHSKPGYRDGVAQILEDFGAAAGFPDVTTMDKDRFREVWEGVEVGKAAHTQANWLGVLGGFARFLEKDDITGKDFTRGVKRPPRSKMGKREQIYSFDAFQPIWEALELWVRPIWEDHWFTGMDCKDLWEFQPRKHLVNVGGAWKIWKQRAKETEIIDQPLASRIKSRWIQAWEASGPEDFLYPEAHKRYANEKSWGNQVRKAVYAAQDKLKLPRLDIKTTRHTFATRHLLRLVMGEKNAPSIEQIRKWMGWAPDSRIGERIYFKLLSLPHLMD